MTPQHLQHLRTMLRNYLKLALRGLDDPANNPATTIAAMRQAADLVEGELKEDQVFRGNGGNSVTVVRERK